MISLSKRRRAILDRGAQLELRSEFDRDELGFASPYWASVSMPHKNPGAVPYWESTNGKVTLSIVPGRVMGREGRMIDAGYPFGVIPRQTLIYLATMAVKTQSPVIDVGNTFHEFMVNLSIKDGSVSRRRVRSQLAALHAANITYAGYEADEQGFRISDRRFVLTKQFDLWANWARDEQPGLWGSQVELSDDFFNHLIEGGALPVYLEDLKALGGSPMRIDIYLWLVFRMYRLRGQVHITWQQLHEQFGSSYARLRDFRKRFEPALRDVLTIYSTAKVAVREDRLVLRRSPLHVPPKDRR